MTSSRRNPILVSLKKGTLEIVKKEPPEIFDHERTLNSNITLVADGLLEKDTKLQIHKIRENVRGKRKTKTPTSLDFDKKFELKTLEEKSKKPPKKRRKPQRSFSSKWLSRPELSDWVCPIANKPGFVFCKVCKGFLRAHLHDLKKHALSRKHRRQTIKACTPFSGKELTNSTFSEHLENTDILASSSTDQIEQGAHGNTEDSKAKVKTDGHSKNKGLKESGSDADYDKSLIPANIGFIGCGNMAQALISGFISSGLVEPNNMVVSAPSEKNLTKLKPHGIKTTHDNKVVVEESHMIFLAVKPHIIPEVLAQLEPLEGDHNPLFVSVAAGLSISRLEAMLGQVVAIPRVIRVMPNTPCMVLQGSCVYSLGNNVLPPEGRILKCLLESVGLCVEVPENQIDAASGVAGSGPAYIYAAIEAMADGGVKMGLPRKVAMALAAQTVKGAAMMVLETGKHPAQLKDEVCSPSGTTITAMHSLEKNGLRNAFISAVEAAASRSKELG